MVVWYRQGKPLISPELSVNHTSSHLVAQQEELAKEIMNLSVRSIFVNNSKGFLTCRKILRDGFTSPPMEGLLRIFIALQNLLPLAGIEPAKLGSSDKHASYYSTEETSGNYYY
jgi:hypothetical protein